VLYGAARTCGKGLNRDLSFNADDRSENCGGPLRLRVLMNDAGVNSHRCVVAPARGGWREKVKE